MGSERLRAGFAEYARFHEHPVNKLLHTIGIPVIVFTAVGLLAKVGWALPVAALVLGYQLTLNVALALGFGLFLALSFLLAPALPASVLWVGFASGWVLQLVGHYAYEKKSPAFLTNLVQLLVAPLWILDAMTGSRFTLPASGPVSESSPHER